MECHLLLHVLEFSTRINDSIQIYTSAQGNQSGHLTSDQVIDQHHPHKIVQKLTQQAQI
jgi:hypothetical protein